jgi:SAM-dependent methyltransferase
MAIDYHSANFLLDVVDHLDIKFRTTITIGRQNLYLSNKELRNLHCYAVGYTILKYNPHTRYCEEFLYNNCGSSSVDVMDLSDYEGARRFWQQDLNLPLKNPALIGQYDTVLDVGSSEHVWNYPEAFKTYMKLLKPDGHYIAILPSNNFNGHGFFQFSPELFFHLDIRGEPLLARLVEYSPIVQWKDITKKDFQNRKRFQPSTRYPTSIMICMKRTVIQSTYYQTDYLDTWLKEPCNIPSYPKWKRWMIETCPTISRILERI